MPPKYGDKKIFSKISNISKSRTTVWAGDEHLPFTWDLVQSPAQKEKRKKTKNCSPYPIGTGALLYGKEAGTHGHFHVLTDSGAVTLPFLGLQSLPDCSLSSFCLPRVQSPWTWMGPEHRPDTPSQGQSLGWDDPRIFPGCRPGSGPAHQLWVAENSVLRLTSTPQWQGPYPLPQGSIAEPSIPDQGRVPLTWSAWGPLQRSRPGMLRQESGKEGAAQGEGCCTATGPLATMSPESSCHENLSVTLCQK